VGGGRGTVRRVSGDGDDLAFIGDAVSHAVFPGVAVAFVLEVNMVAGGMVGGLVVSVLIALLTDRLAVMMVLAPLIGVASSIVGLYLSYHNNLATGGLIVLVVTGAFLASWTLAPRHGLVAKVRLRRRHPAAVA
jgi:manganese/iron transport system permease protein